MKKSASGYLIRQRNLSYKRNDSITIIMNRSIDLCQDKMDNLVKVTCKDLQNNRMWQLEFCRVEKLKVTSIVKGYLNAKWHLRQSHWHHILNTQYSILNAQSKHLYCPKHRVTEDCLLSTRWRNCYWQIQLDLYSYTYLLAIPFNYILSNIAIHV